MKLWKKFALLLSLSFAFSSMAACDSLVGGDEEESSSVSNSESVSEDNSESVSEDNSEGEEVEVDETYNIAVEADVATTDTGFDMKLGIDLDEKLLGDGEDAAEIAKAISEVYFVDGFAYVQLEDGWEKSPCSIFYEMNDETFVDAYGFTSSLLAELSNVSASSTTTTLSLANDVNSVIDYLVELNSETKLVDVIDDVLALEGTSYTELMTGISEMNLGAITVAEVYDEVNAIVVEEFACTLPELKEAMFADEAFYAAIVEEFGEENAQAAKDFDITTVKTEYGTMTMDDVLNWATDGDVATVAILISAFNAELQEVTLGDIFGTQDPSSMDSEDTVEYYFEDLAVIEFAKLDVTASLEATGGKLATAVLDFAVVVEIGEGNDAVSCAFNASYTLNFVDEIVAPANAIVTCYACGEAVDVELYDNEVYYCADCKAKLDAIYGEYTLESYYFNGEERVLSKTLTVVLSEDGTWASYYGGAPDRSGEWTEFYGYETLADGSYLQYSLYYSEDETQIIISADIYETDGDYSEYMFTKDVA